MGTTSQKLTYLNTTKFQLKDMINYGLDNESKITNETTFREYVNSTFEAFMESLRNPDTLFNNLPKVTGEGTSVTLDNTANAPMKMIPMASELSQDGEPTPETPQEIHTISRDNKIILCGKNIFVPEKVISDSNNAETYITQDKNWIRFKTGGDRLIYYPTNVKENTRYTFKVIAKSGDATTNSIGLTAFYTDGTSSSVIDIPTSDTNEHIAIGTTSSSKTLSYFRSLFSYDKEAFIKIIGTQLVEGVYTIYTMPEYKPISNYPLTLDDLEVCKIGDYKDEFVYNTTDTTLELNKWYLKKNIGKVVLDGVNNVVFPNDTNANSYLYNFALNHLKGEAKSNYFTHIDAYPSSTGSGGKFNSTKTSSVIYFSGYGIVSGDNATLRSATEFNTWLSTHNTTVYYPLSTSTYISLNDTLQTQLNNIQKVLAYQDQTNVSQVNNDLPFTINVSAIEDLI